LVLVCYFKTLCDKIVLVTYAIYSVVKTLFYPTGGVGDRQLGAFLNLELRSPLLFKKIYGNPPSAPGINNEIILCYELNPAQARSIEPDREMLLRHLQFAGEKADGAQSAALPAGHYIFAQSRGDASLNQEEWLDMAVDLQKDGLWERNKLGDLLYVRFLFEDDKFVTQIFRPVI